jgi:putative ABC transport system permease protein
VGVAREAVYDLLDLSRPTSAVYRPLVAEDYRLARLLVRTRGDAASAAYDVRLRLRGIVPDSRTGATVLGDVLRRQVAVIRIPARFASIAAVTVLLLAIVGLYGLTAFRVRQRVREIGVRMALGASRTAVIRGLLRDGLRPVVVGLVVGVGAAAIFTPAVRTADLDPSVALRAE